MQVNCTALCLRDFSYKHALFVDHKRNVIWRLTYANNTQNDANSSRCAFASPANHLLMWNTNSFPWVINGDATYRPAPYGTTREWGRQCGVINGKMKNVNFMRGNCYLFDNMSRSRLSSFRRSYHTRKFNNALAECLCVCVCRSLLVYYTCLNCVSHTVVGINGRINFVSTTRHQPHTERRQVFSHTFSGNRKILLASVEVAI